jgi:hypothetical protein
MKKSLYLLACLFLVGTLSCTSDEDTPENVTPTAEKEYTVSLGFSGEITDISEFPLTKASGNDLYGIQVYSYTTDSTKCTNYAYGFFDDVSKMTVKLLDGYKYIFRCTMLKDGKNSLYSYENQYADPFYIREKGNALLNNTFVYSSDYYMGNLNESFASIVSLNEGRWRPFIDRYYGELCNFTPAENKTANIYMKRESFGVKFIAEGLTEGSLIIDMDLSPEIVIAYPATEVQHIMTMFNHNNNWLSDDAVDVVTTSIYWLKADSAKIPIASQDITFKPNKLTVITVKVADTSIASSLSLTTETTEMTPTDSVTINSSTGIDTPVNP